MSIEGGPTAATWSDPQSEATDDAALKPLLAVIVDNHVQGDSRVQKCAIAAAEAGYRVTLIGRADGLPDTYTIGSPSAPVEVRRVEAPFRLLALSRRAPRGRWRYPLAYPSADHAARRSLRLKALTFDLQARKLLLREPAASPSRVTELLLFAQTLRLIAGRYRHMVRALSFRWMSTRAKREDSPGYRLGSHLRSAFVGPGAWRSLDPVLLDVELAFGPVLDELSPDILHANDFRMSGVAIRAAARARARGRRMAVVYDAHESVTGVVSRSLRWRTANAGHEAEYIGHADVVLTVSDRLADLLQQRHRLPARPRVVLNAPQFTADALPQGGGLRVVCGLSESTPLLTYCGSAAPQRGLEDAIDALAALPGVHLALVIAHPARAEELLKRAAEIGVADRLHVVDYVPQDQVVPFLRSASAGIIPIHHLPNHEIALITKYFEYAHAGLPIITSDTETMGETTRQLGNGEVFVAQDVSDLARAARAVLADPQRYRDVYQRRPDVLQAWSWPEQTKVLLQVYIDALARTPHPPPEELTALD